MMEPRSNATIRALASLAELSANQLEEGVSVEVVIATLRKAAEAVCTVVDADDEPQTFDAEAEADADMSVVELASGADEDEDADTESAEITVLNAG